MRDDRAIYLQLLAEWSEALEAAGEAVALRRDWLVVGDLMTAEVRAWRRLQWHARARSGAQPPISAGGA